MPLYIEFMFLKCPGQLTIMDEHSIPLPEVLTFGQYTIDVTYRAALYVEHPLYTIEEIVGSYLGHNPYYPSQDVWIDLQDNPSSLFCRRNTDDEAEAETETDTDRENP